MHERECQVQLLLSSAAQGLCSCIAIPLIAKPLDELIRVRQVVQLIGSGKVGEMLVDGKCLVQNGKLRTIADSPEPFHGPAIWPQFPGQDPQERGFPGAIFANNPNECARLNGEADTLKDMVTTERAVKVAGHQKRARFRRLSHAELVNQIALAPGFNCSVGACLPMEGRLRPVDRLIVDGYNMIFAWPELAALKDVKLEDARDLLVAMLADYAAMTQQRITVVFDSHRRADAEASEQMISGVQVLYSGRKTSADHVIEKLLFETRPGDEVTVATSDSLQRDLALGREVKTVSAATLKAQIDAVLARRDQRMGDSRAQSDIARRLEDRLDPKTRERLDRLRRGESGK